MDYFDSKVLESFMIPEDIIATEGVIGKAALGIGSVLAGYALLILGIGAAIKYDKSNKKKKEEKVYQRDKVDPDLVKSTANKCEAIANAAFNDIKKLLQDKKYLTTLRKSIADKLKIDISKVPTNFKPHIVEYTPDKSVIMIDSNTIINLYTESNKLNDLDFTEEEFGYYLNSIICPSLDNIIAKLRQEYYGPEIGQNLIKLRTSTDIDDFKEISLWVFNRC